MTITQAPPAPPDVRPDPRAPWFGDVRSLLDAAETIPSLPWPFITREHADFFTPAFGPGARKWLADAEAALTAALGVTFEALPEPSGPCRDYVVFAGLPGGLQVRLLTRVRDVAEQQVTGQTVTDITEWVRLPVEDPADDADLLIGEDDEDAA
jgi:hypothetical protein